MQWMQSQSGKYDGRDRKAKAKADEKGYGGHIPVTTPFQPRVKWYN